ncbi:hypothetical protein VP1G_08189 [Cytospora mali]|uniref:Rhodopsin domain-containing protein n=1 Tax=Cytospora mali TaxID=578113 RepID=A0A194VAT6_CYTMA|nr:hypothetical protein VP1G_08189 [Valsa mali var. pyri (nom. inval.)]
MANTPGLGPTILWVMWIETLVSLLFVCLRLYTRATLVRNVGIDDHLSWVSMVLFLGYSVFISIAVGNGLGRHAADLTVAQFATAVKWELIGQTCNILAIGTTKSSVAFFLARLVVQKWHKVMLYFCVATTSLTCISCIILMYAQCTPLQSIWDPRVTGVCHYNFTADAVFSGAYTAAMDFFLAAIPWFILWNVNMKHATVSVMLWGSTELLVCLICATLPGLRPLWRKVKGGSSTDMSSGHMKTPSNAYFKSNDRSGIELQSKQGDGASHWSTRNRATKGDPEGISDDASEEHILGPECRKHGITRTTEVDVSYSSREGSSISDKVLQEDMR